MGPISVAATRAGLPESRDRVHCVLVRHGAAAGAAGDPGLVTFWRSCAKPVQALPLVLERLGTGQIEPATRVLAAIRAHPELVGGERTIDTRLGRALPGAMAKRGAEGLLCGVLPDGAGFALKAEDGAERALSPAAGAFLGLDALRETPVLSTRGERVGALVRER